MKKVLLVSNIPNPYRLPLLAEMSRQFLINTIELKVVFGSLGYERRKWELTLDNCGFQCTTLQSKKIILGNHEKTLFLYSGLWHEMNEYKPDLIIATGFSFATIKALLYKLVNKVPVIIWTGTVINKGRQENFLRKIFRKILIKNADGFVTYGTRTAEYLMNLSAAQDKISIGINTTDTAFFANHNRFLAQPKTANAPLKLLSLGYITKGKRLDLLIPIMHELKKRGNKILLTVVGDGPEKNNIISLVKKYELTDDVVFIGYKQKDEVRKILPQHDVFLFPTEYDIWGIVIIEAMAAGLLCFSSVHAGVTPDLIIDGVTGYAADFENKNDMVEKIENLIRNPQLVTEIQKAAMNQVLTNASISKSAEGFTYRVMKTLQV